MFGKLPEVGSSPEETTSAVFRRHSSSTRLTEASANENGEGGDLRGLVPRCLDFIFAYLNHQSTTTGSSSSSSSRRKIQDAAGESGGPSFVCTAQFLEVYQEQVHDLLDAGCPTLRVREDLERGSYVDGAVEEDVTDAFSAQRLLLKGEKHRHVAATAMNHVSSRSHAIFILKVTAQVIAAEETRLAHGDNEDNDDHGITATKTVVSKFNMVDLAGSERQNLTHAEGIRLKEASGINKSLSTLGLVIQALVDRAKGLNRHVHYRDSKVTFLLRDSLGGNSKTTMLCNVSPALTNFGETLSSLRFAQRVKEIPTHAQVNEDYSLLDVKTLKAQVNALRKENAQLRLELKRASNHAQVYSSAATPTTTTATTRRPSFALHRGTGASVGFAEESLMISTSKGGSPRHSVKSSKSASPRNRDFNSNRFLRASTGDFLHGDSGAPGKSFESTAGAQSPAPLIGRRARNRAEVKLLSSELNKSDNAGSEQVAGGEEEEAQAAESLGLKEEARRTTAAPSGGLDNDLALLTEKMKAYEIQRTKERSRDPLPVEASSSPAFTTSLTPMTSHLVGREEVERSTSDELFAGLKAAVDTLSIRTTEKSGNKEKQSSPSKSSERFVLNLEGIVSRLEVEKTELEDELDAMESSLRVAQSECQDLASQVLFAQAQQREAEASAAEARRTTHLTSLGVDPSIQLRQKLEVLQKELTRHQKAAKASEAASKKLAQDGKASVAALEQELSSAHAEVARLKRLGAEQSREISSLMRHRLLVTLPPAPPTSIGNNQSAAPSTSSLSDDAPPTVKLVEQPSSSSSSSLSSSATQQQRQSSPTHSLTSSITSEAPSSSSTSFSSPSVVKQGLNKGSTVRNPIMKTQRRIIQKTATPKKSTAAAAAAPSMLTSPVSSSLSSPSSSVLSSAPATLARSGFPDNARKTVRSINRVVTPGTSQQPDDDTHVKTLGPPRSVANTPTSRAAATSKTNQRDRREQQKREQQAKERAEASAEASARERRVDAFSALDTRDLARLGFFATSEVGDGDVTPSPPSPPPSTKPFGESLLAARREASRGVRTKGVTVNGTEASLSQTLAEIRMKSVEAELSKSQSTAEAQEEGSSLTQTPWFCMLDLKKDLCPSWKRLETRLERGHAILALLNTLHRCKNDPTFRAQNERTIGSDDELLASFASCPPAVVISAGEGCEALAAVCWEAAASPGGTFWDAQGIKLDKAVALRASDHCRVALLGAKATLLVRRHLLLLQRQQQQRRPEQTGISAHRGTHEGEAPAPPTEARATLALFLNEAVRLVADTEARRGAVSTLFGEASVDARTAATEEMLEMVVSEGTASMHETQQIIADCLRLLTVQGHGD